MAILGSTPIEAENGQSSFLVVSDVGADEEGLRLVPFVSSI